MSSAHRPETGDIARHRSSIAATSLYVAENGLQRGQQSTVHELSAHVASDAHSAPAFAAVSAWQDNAISAVTEAMAQMCFTRSIVDDFDQYEHEHGLRRQRSLQLTAQSESG